jgi:hypothetical protein
MFTIKTILNGLDLDGFIILELEELMPNSVTNNNTISTIYLDIDIKNNRKTKLQKLNVY